MNGFAGVFRRELKSFVKNRYIFITAILAPLIFSFILILVFFSRIASDLPIAVLDADNSNVSRTIVRAIDSTPSVKVKYKVSNINEGQKLIKEFKAYALIYIPQNFSGDLNMSERPKIVYYYNNQTILIGGVISKDIQSAVLNCMTGSDAKIRMKRGLSKEAALSKINLIRVDERVKSNPYLNYSYFLSYATIAHCFQVLITFMAIWAAGSEFRKGTTKIWLKVAGGSVINAVMGKLAVYFILYFMLLTLVYLLYIIFFEAPFRGNVLFTLLGEAAFIFAYQMMGILFVAVLSNLRFALSAGAFYTSLGFSLAGMTFPSIAMPAFARFYSALIPVRPFVNLMVDQAVRGFNFIYDIKYLVWLFALSLAGLLSLPLLKKHAKDEGLWYQI